MEGSLMDVYVGVPVGGDDAHITLVLSKGCTGEQIQAIIRSIDSEMSPLFPLVFQILPEIHMFGYKHDIPVHKVKLFDETAIKTLKDTYRRFYQQTEGETTHLEWEPHVSVDSEKKRAAVDAILKDGKGIFIAHTAYMKQIGEKNILYKMKP